MKLLKGESVLPLTMKKAKNLIGHRIEYLTGADIDTSGRGYFFPRLDIVEDVVGREIVTSTGNYINFSRFVECVDKGEHHD